MIRTPSRLVAVTVLAGLLAGCQFSAEKPNSPVCTATPGSAVGELLIRADLILPSQETPFTGELLVKDDKIACVATDCAAQAPQAAVLDCPGALLSPGLINPHDHMGWTTYDPIPTDIRYDNRYQWQGKQGSKPVIDYGKGDYSKEALAWGEIRHLMAGTTSVAGTGGVPGLMRNLEYNKYSGGDKLREGLPGSMSYNSFPWTNTDYQPITTESCKPYGFFTPKQLEPFNSFEPHVAEGIDHVANFFLKCESGQLPDGQDLEMRKSAFIHVVAADAGQVERMVKKETAWIWSPRSNVALYGDTAALPLYKTLGVKMALSSDWTISGSMNLLREFRCATELDDNYFGDVLSDRELVDMVTFNASEATHTAPYIGQLTPGSYADLTLFAPSGDPARPYRAILDAEPADVVMVMRGGILYYGDDNVVTALVPNGASECDAIEVCGGAKRFCLQSSDVSPNAQSILQLQKYLTEKAGKAPYPLLFCGAPEKEPSCLPERPGHYSGIPSENDRDGDGVKDREDNCVSIFNPVRPMDGIFQADYDDDGIGDACDPTPLGGA